MNGNAGHRPLASALAGVKKDLIASGAVVYLAFASREGAHRHVGVTEAFSREADGFWPGTASRLDSRGEIAQLVEQRTEKGTSTAIRAFITT